MTSCHYLETENKALGEAYKPITDIEVKGGDLLFSRKNTYDLVGACAFVFSTRPHLMLPDLIFRIKVKENSSVIPEYIWGLFTQKSKRKQIKKLASGSAGSMPNISKSRLQKLQIELPPIEIQRNFSLCLHKQHAMLERMRSLYALADNLFYSLVHLAFRGELTSRAADAILQQTAAS